MTLKYKHRLHEWLRDGVGEDANLLSSTVYFWKCLRCSARISKKSLDFPILQDALDQGIHLDCDTQLIQGVMES